MAIRWTKRQDWLLETLHAEGLSYPQIAERVGKSTGACENRMSRIVRRKLEDGGFILAEPSRDGGKRKRQYYKAPTAALPEPLPPSEPSARSLRLSILQEDAELRRRIAILGPNGLLGDPMPGRSALDQKRNTTTTGESHASHY
ncbi:MAG: sigma factor-like helix-turn-helix DNA-binding protein [Bryobacteraceae bacterium]